MDFGRNLKRYRKDREMTQEQLAAAVGVAKTTISGYENNSREPGLMTIIKLSQALEIPVDTLLGNTPKKNPPDKQPSEEDAAVMLYQSLLHSGFLKQGQELTRQQFAFLDGLSILLSAFFEQ